MVEEKNNTDEEEDLLVLFVQASANEANLISKHLQGIFEIKKNMENGTI